MSLAENYNPVTQTDQLLLKKKGIYANEKNANALRNVIKNEQDQQYKQSKPFAKKYGSQNTTAKLVKELAPQSRQSQSNQPKSQKEIVSGKAELQHKNNTKQSFNKKLHNNIIKDEIQQSPNSKQSYRIKKLPEAKLLSPKQTLDNLMTINEEEGKLQRQILQIHKSTKSELQRIKMSYKIENKKITDYLSDKKDEEGNVIHWDESQNSQKAIEKLDQIIKQKQKQLLKHQQKISANAYLQFLQKMPSNIEQMNESEEEDEVDQLPQDRPRLQGNRGSYSITMTSMKSKNYALNLRRTYEVFKGEEDKHAIQQNASPNKEEVKQEIIKEQGQNRMTLNQKFKDFLLS